MSLMHGRGSWDGRSHGIKRFRESSWNDGVAIVKQLNSMSLCFFDHYASNCKTDTKQPLSGMRIISRRSWEVRRQSLLFRHSEEIWDLAVLRTHERLRAELIGWSEALPPGFSEKARSLAMHLGQISLFTFKDPEGL